ncbi:hypothetical protein ACTL6P_10115 [Endozoicomonas acroporae]|uniref:hypothetical protein n=1 Tax=Endozoicomonas acroporae TaxID=1701104 RepID=UPI0011AEE858|nr:hypothetical protein [Endozoicomonas acroporae]
MISQPAVQSTGAPMASGSVPVQPTENWGLLAGVKVATWDIPILFLRSLHPGYIPPGTQPSAQPDEGPAFTFGSPDGQDSSFFQGVELAARLVSPYTVLPAEIRTMLEGIVTFSAATRFRDLLGAFGATEGSPPTESRADISEDGSPTNDKGRKKKKPQQTPQRTSPPATASIGTGQLPKTAVALGALSSLTAAAAASSSSSNTEEPILVPNATILGKIGDPGYPMNGTYQQTADINVTRSFRSIGSRKRPFTGKYDGKGKTIRGLRRCLMKNLEGKVRRLHFKDARIEEEGKKTVSIGVAACNMSGKAVIRKITVKDSVLVTKGDRESAGVAVGNVNGGIVEEINAENCSVTTSGSFAYAGIGAGYVHNGGKVEHTNAKNCKVNTTSSDAGIGVGRVNNGSVFDTKATNCKVETSGGNAGIGAGRVDKGRVRSTIAKGCNVTNSGSFGNAGIGIGVGRVCKGKVLETKATNCKVKTSRGNAGIGAGRVDDRKGVVKTEAVNCNVTNYGSFGNASIGVGSGTATETRAINCEIETFGKKANAGIGAGSGNANDTKAMNCSIKAFGNETDAGIGAGYNIATKTLAINCEVENHGFKGKIGIGVGKGYATDTTAMNCEVKDFGPSGTTAGVGAGMGGAANTIAINCTVETSGDSAYSGIGAGFFTTHENHGSVDNTKSFNSTVKNSGASGFAGIGIGNGIGKVVKTTAVKSDVKSSQAKFQNNFGAGPSPTFCNVRVNRDNITAKDCDRLLGHFCEDIDPDLYPRLVKSDCQPTHCYSSALSSDTVYDAFEKPCPPEPTTIPTKTSTNTPTSRPTSPTVVPTTPAAEATASNTTIVVPTTPAKVPPASNTTISLPGATMTLPASAAPLATTLSTGAIAGIAAAASFVLAGVVGGYIYRHCCRRSSPDAAGHWQELGAVNKAGQAQELVDQPMMLLEEPGDKGGHQHEHIYEEIGIYNPRRMRTARAPDY